MMKNIFTLLIVFGSFTLYAQDIPNARFPFDPARKQPVEDRKGEVFEREFADSKIYPGTKRKYWVYVPAAYAPDKPACLYTGMDGISFDAPTVFDNLIESGEMPVTIGVFVQSGTVYDSNNEVIRYNRSNEFDKTDDTFARFLIEELLPDAEKQQTADGRPVRFSGDPNDRAIAGNSSGAICAFTAAWNRPDVWSRVFSAIGTYVPMRGGNEYPALIRKTEPKPLRIFLQDGEKDTWNPLFGSWFDANLNMQSALSFAGYEMTHAWGTGGHDGNHAHEIFPDVMRWLWKGWPAKVQSGPSKNDMLVQILDPEHRWEEAPIPSIPQGNLYSNSRGELFFADSSGTVYGMNDRGRWDRLMQLPTGEKLMACAEKKLYSIGGKGKINVYADGKKQTLSGNYPGAEGLLVTAKGIYLARRAAGTEREIWLLNGKGGKSLVDETTQGGIQMMISPDHRMLITSEENSHWLYNYTVEQDAAISNRQRWYWLHNTDNRDFEVKGNMMFDLNGNLYAATPLGVQVCDQNGRVRAILTLPSGKIDALAFAGAEKDMLYVLSQGKLYRRKMKTEGITPDAPPVKIASQGGG
ncbi:MAG: SMP-30/gluconolactonase/LRE family protein [Bacteroidales bacterium]|jgi:enterochelin esterase-like enzyme|nr:SMP-30/gluconolactonase/LRE family protein [Bacteroidales bacterium]